MSVSHANSAMLVTLNINKVCQSKSFSHAGCVEYQSLSAMLTQLCWLCWILKSVSHADSAMLVLFLCFSKSVSHADSAMLVLFLCWFCFMFCFVSFFLKSVSHADSAMLVALGKLYNNQMFKQKSHHCRFVLIQNLVLRNSNEYWMMISFCQWCQDATSGLFYIWKNQVNGSTLIVGRFIYCLKNTCSQLWTKAFL